MVAPCTPCCWAAVLTLTVNLNEVVNGGGVPRPRFTLHDAAKTPPLYVGRFPRHQWALTFSFIRWGGRNQNNFRFSTAQRVNLGTATYTDAAGNAHALSAADQPILLSGKRLVAYRTHHGQRSVVRDGIRPHRLNRLAPAKTLWCLPNVWTLTVNFLNEGRDGGRAGKRPTSSTHERRQQENRDLFGSVFSGQLINSR